MWCVFSTMNMVDSCQFLAVLGLVQPQTIDILLTETVENNGH